MLDVRDLLPLQQSPSGSGKKERDTHTRAREIYTIARRRTIV
jgi:hypothetical protein